MAVNAQTTETYDNLVIREDLREPYYMVSPEEVPFQQAIGTGQDVTNTYHEWPVLELAAVDLTNRVIEGDDDPAVNAATLPNRRGNYTQISDINVSVSHTNEAIDSAARNVNKMAKQVAIHLRELRRSVEGMLTQNIPAAVGSSGTARATAGFPAFLRSNVYPIAGATLPTLSGTTNGYPNAGYVLGTVPIPLTETMFNDNIEDVWNAGGNPTMAMVHSKNKRIISETFTGSSTIYKDRVDRTLVNAVDVYDSDFGQLTIVPNRFMSALDPTFPSATTSWPVYLIDPDYAEVCYLDSWKQKDLGETGHSFKKLVWGEYVLVVTNEAAHGMIPDTTGTAT